MTVASGDKAFSIKLSEHDFDTLMFLSNCVKVRAHVEADKPMADYQHREADAAAVIDQTLTILLEGVRRSGSWERNLADVAFPEFDDLRQSAHYEYLQEQANVLQERWEELDHLAGAAEDTGDEPEFERLLEKIALNETHMEELQSYIEAAERLIQNPGLL